MRQKFNVLFFAVALLGLFLSAHQSAIGQPATVVIDQVKNSCGTQNNGSFRITVTAGTGPFSVFYVGINDGQSLVVPLSLNVPETIGVPPPGLDIGLRPDNYFIIVNDGDGSPNFNTLVTIGTTGEITAINSSVTNNSDCSAPDGAISITSVTGGSGNYTFSW